MQQTPLRPKRLFKLEEAMVLVQDESGLFGKTSHALNDKLEYLVI